MNRGLSLTDLFYVNLPFEPYPMISFFFIIIGDGILYFIVEFLFQKLFSKSFSIKGLFDNVLWKFKNKVSYIL